ncbi:MAG: MATE family efflux transporter [Clostridium sp.]|nr:MATE family efflux transporter [Clostridium sp.]
MDMTQGNIWKLLSLFAVPLLFGNLFQQLYNTVDSIIVGNFVGKNALAAVGSTTAICNTMVNFFNGISIGAGVVISNYFGARERENLQRAIHTIALLTVILGIGVTLISVPWVPLMLRLIATPDGVIGHASIYLRIYFLGIFFLFTYNMGSSVLRAVGDTKRPLYFLITSSLLNIVLDLVFVVVFGWGIAGVAAATVFSQAVSALLVCAALMRTGEAYKLCIKNIRMDLALCRRILLLGLPIGVQQSLTAFSNAFVQSYINAFDSASIMAGWSCHIKIDQFCILPVMSIGHSVTTFVSQNLGAKKLERAKAGVRTAIYMGTGLLILICVILAFTSGQLVKLFNRDAEVVYYGILFVWLSIPFRFFSAWNQTYAGALRGSGNTKTSMLIMLFSLVVCRQVYLYVITRFANNVYTVGLGYPVGWICCGLLSRWYYKHSGWEEKYIEQEGR